jgi:hypothetical protein
MDWASYIYHNVSFGDDSPMSSYTKSVYKCFGDCVESNVDCNMIDQFMRDHLDCELLLETVHECLILNYRNYKNNCLRQQIRGRHANPENDNLFTTGYAYLPSTVRDQYSEICWYVIHKISEDYLMQKLECMEI